ncbi:MAG: MerR family transcriptional regulator [Candidatus Faecousia sp.]|nr:MerR family transcriptional regulator [Candidatus Faecousia sp.]
MKEACEMTGLRYETLKFYCNQALVPNVRRDPQNRRIFSDEDISWIRSLECLKNCGMGIKEMQEYLGLCQEGPATIPERKEILERKRLELEQEQLRIRESIAYIDRKQAYYDDILSCANSLTADR